MPVISSFYGLVAKIYPLGKEHDPPHVHFLYGNCMGVVDLNSLTVVRGDLPAKAQAMAVEWTTLHQSELLNMWNSQNYMSLPPLE